MIEDIPLALSQTMAPPRTIKSAATTKAKKVSTKESDLFSRSKYEEEESQIP